MSIETLSPQIQPDKDAGEIDAEIKRMEEALLGVRPLEPQQPTTTHPESKTVVRNIDDSNDDLDLTRANRMSRM